MRRKTRKKKTGISLLLFWIALALSVQAGKKQEPAETYALVSGTVFHDSGFALAGAAVTLIPDPSPSGPSVKVKKMQAVCNSRGEFVFRVPPTNMRYTVKAAAKGYHEEDKHVEVHSEERVEVTFLLQKESK
jgi:hypothetical protein